MPKNLFVDEDGFVFIKGQTKSFHTVPNINKIDKSSDMTVEEAELKIKEGKKILKLECGSFLKKVVKLICSKLKINKTSIVCIGLGSLVSNENFNYSSVFQLVLLREIVEYLNCEEVLCFDPTFREADVKLLGKLNIKAKSNTFSNNYSMKEKGNILFYMPHCPKSCFKRVMSLVLESKKTKESVLFVNKIDKTEVANLKELNVKVNEVVLSNYISELTESKKVERAFSGLSIVDFKRQLETL